MWEANGVPFFTYFRLRDRDEAKRRTLAIVTNLLSSLFLDDLGRPERERSLTLFGFTHFSNDWRKADCRNFAKRSDISVVLSIVENDNSDFCFKWDTCISHLENAITNQSTVFASQNSACLYLFIIKTKMPPISISLQTMITDLDVKTKIKLTKYFRTFVSQLKS